MLSISHFTKSASVTHILDALHFVCPPNKVGKKLISQSFFIEKSLNSTL